MRIIAGSRGGRTLKAPGGESCRPAMARTREALFSILESRGLCWAGLRILDLFAGSGSLAFEALSRGAEAAVLVENSPQALRVIGENVKKLDFTGRAHLNGESVLRFLKRAPAEPFGLVFIDPPYRQRLIAPAMRLLVGQRWLAPGALVAAEVEKDLRLTNQNGLDLLVDRLFGQTRVLIFGATAEEA